MPDWFIPLINKVIKEGDNLSGGPALDFMGHLKKKGPVYKRDVTNLEEGKIVHTKKLPDGEEVKVTQNINEGSVTVDYKTPNSMAEKGVTLTYREGSELVPHSTIPNAMTTKYRSKKEPPSFNAMESYPEAHRVGPEDVEITFEGTNDALKVDDLFSDTSKLKQFATGKKLTKQELKIAKEKTDKVAKINERPEDVLPDYDWDDVVDPSDYAQGGIAGQLHLNRPGFNKGKKVDLSKRKFLKGTGAAVGVLSMLPFVGKFFKPAAKAVKSLTSVPITQTGDMPQWFVPLVNKVIKEGDDVTKTFGEVERQIVHKTKLPDSKTDVIVTQDLSTGDVAVDIGMGKHGWGDGHLGQPVRLEYKASEWIEPNPAGGGYITSQGKEVYPGMSKGAFKTEKTTGKGLKTKEEFWVEEAEFTGGHPENIKFEESTFEKFGAHGSDFSEVEKFATGKVTKTKPSIKAERAHWVPEEDYAAGGIAEGGRVPLGGIAGQLHLNQGGRVSFTKGGLARILGV
jgi:hypothetical protein